MCGIAVAIDWEGAAEAVKHMISGLHHRGAVSDPIISPRPNCAMATRRLPIVDVENGVQPQVSWDGRVLVSFNGEIYNHLDIRLELEAKGAKFRTSSDTEVLAAALSIWGPQALKRLNGMFAFVAIDVASGLFLAARDMFGAKPLYLIRGQTGFLFCSEIRPLLTATGEGDVLLLPPGYLLTRDRCIQFQSFEVDPATPKAKSAPRELDRLLAGAVASRVPPDHPFALLFSGGIDSTLVAHYARQVRPQVPAYFLGDENAPDYEYAHRYAEMTHLDLRMVDPDIVTADPAEIIASIVSVVESFEPEVIRGSHCTWHLTRRIQQDGYRIALCGEGADELFAGYVPLELAFADSEIAGIFVRNQHLGTINKTCLQRNDRCGMHFQIELREPFLDRGVVAYALALGGDSLIEEIDGHPRGKAPLRALYDIYPGELPASIRDRRKVPMNEGCGFDREQGAGPFVDYANQAVGDRTYAEGKKRFKQFDLRSKEEYFYLEALAASMDVFRVPHLTARARLIFPKVKNFELLERYSIAK